MLDRFVLEKIAPAKMLEKFIQRELVSSLKGLPSLCEQIYPVLETLFQGLGVFSLECSLYPILNALSFSEQEKCLLGIKCYLNSEDFHCTGRYKSKSYFFGEYGSKTDIFNSIETALDKKIQILIDEEKLQIQEEKIAKATPAIDNQKKKFSKVTASSISPFALMGSLLVFSAIAESKKLFPTLNQSYVPKAPEFAWGQCFPVDELPILFHVMSNAPLREVEQFYFGENHKNSTHKLVQDRFTSALSQPADIVRFEGGDSQKRYKCSDGRNIPDTLDCRGWENMVIFNKVSSMPALEKLIKLNPIQDSDFEYIWTSLKDKSLAFLVTKEQLDLANKSIQNLSAFWTELEKHNNDSALGVAMPGKRLLTDIKIASEKITNKEAILAFMKQVLTVRSQLIECGKKMLNKFKESPDRIKNRNKNIIELNKKAQIDNQNRKKQGKRPLTYFTYGGSDHFVPESHRLTGNFDQPINSQEPCYELRDSLANSVAHAVLIPK